MPLNDNQIHNLGDPKGPYSIVNLCFETQILNNQSKEHVVVSARINPLTFEIVSKNLKHFEEDDTVRALIAHAKHEGEDKPYRSETYRQPLIHPEVVEQAHAVLAETNAGIQRMHSFVNGIIKT